MLALIGFYIYTNILSVECDKDHSNIKGSGTQKPKQTQKDDVVHDYSSGDE
jgi:hypothetical protein